MKHILWVMKSRKKKIFFEFFFFEFFNKDFSWLSVELTHDMGTIRKLSTWSRRKKSQKLEKSTFKKKILRLSKALISFLVWLWREHPYVFHLEEFEEDLEEFLKTISFPWTNIPFQYIHQHSIDLYGIYQMRSKVRLKFYSDKWEGLLVMWIGLYSSR